MGLLARRVIPTILFRGTEVFKGVGFQSSRRIGNLRQAVRLYQARGVDELVLLDISGNPPDIGLIRDLAGECFMPVTVGGGIRSLEHVSAMIANGADKVALNTAATMEAPDLVVMVARKFGSQAVVASIDVKQGTVWTRCGTADTGRDPVEVARSVCDRGAGEILLTSIERDGGLCGYDLDLVGRVSRAVPVPVIAAGGAGSYADLKAGLEAGAHAVAAGALWAWTDCTPAGAAEYLAAQGVPVRRKLAA